MLTNTESFTSLIITDLLISCVPFRNTAVTLSIRKSVTLSSRYSIVWYGSFGQVSWDVVGFTQYYEDIQKLNSSSSRKKRQRGKESDAGTFLCRSCAFLLLLVITTVVCSAGQSSKECVEAMA